MLLNKVLILPFNFKTKNGIIFNKDSYNWDIIYEKINNKQYLGSYGINHYNINLTDISHLIENIYIEDDGVYADIKILKTHRGNRLLKLIKSGNELIFRFIISFSTNIDNKKFVIYTINSINPDNDYFDIKLYYRKRKIDKLLSK